MVSIEPIFWPSRSTTVRPCQSRAWVLIGITSSSSGVRAAVPRAFKRLTRVAVANMDAPVFRSPSRDRLGGAPVQDEHGTTNARAAERCGAGARDEHAGLQGLAG